MLVFSSDQQQYNIAIKRKKQMLSYLQKPKKQKSWSESEIKILAGFHNAGIPPEELTEIFGRTANALKHRANIHGIKLGAKK